MNTNLILRKRHVDKDITNKDQHDAQHCERKCLRIVMEILRNVHIVKTNESVEVLLFDLDMSELTNFHHELHLFLVSQSLINKDVLDVFSLGVDLEILVLEGIVGSLGILLLLLLLLLFLLVIGLGRACLVVSDLGLVTHCSLWGLRGGTL